MPESHDYLGLIGVDAWVRRDYVVPGSEAPPSGQGGAVPAADPASGFDPADWSSLESAVSGC
ncbi:MAG: hypothetical protein KJO38_10455, partial [Gammaproteobacteria bacterium]|nr:hypothetical protein [Gammaproteobacteria bacterium]